MAFPFEIVHKLFSLILATWDVLWSHHQNLLGVMIDSAGDTAE